MEVLKHDRKKPWNLRSFVNKHEHEHSSGRDLFDEPNIVDYKIAIHSHEHAVTDYLTVPFNVQHIMATVLMTEMPVKTEALVSSGVELVFYIDELPRIRYQPKNVELDPLVVSDETTMVLMKIDYDLDLSFFRSDIIGAN